MFNSKTTIKAEKDCSGALESIHPKMIKTLNYEKLGIPKNIGYGFTSFFNVEIEKGCEVESCLLKDEYCNSQPKQINVISSSKHPFIL